MECLVHRFDKFLPPRNIRYGFRILKVIKALFYYRKNVWIVGIICNSKGIVFEDFGCLKISRGISLALNVLASISDLGYFCSVFFFSLLKRFCFILIFDNSTYSSCKREQCIC